MANIQKKGDVKRIDFWLSYRNEEHRYLMKLISYLKENRIFAPTVRHGLLLVAQLRQGDFSLLREQYADVIDLLWEQEHYDFLSDEILRLKNEQQQVTELKQKLQEQIEQLAHVQNLISATRTLNNPHPNTVHHKARASPVMEDELDTLEVVTAEVDGTQASENFFNLMQGFQTS